jgi:hypothetical protein
MAGLEVRAPLENVPRHVYGVGDDPIRGPLRVGANIDENRAITDCSQDLRGKHSIERAPGVIEQLIDRHAA